MSEQPLPALALSRALRGGVLVIAIAQTVFWAYTWYYIIGHANPMGDGMELVAIAPMSFIFLIFVAPALLNAVSGRALHIAAVLLLAGAGANAILFNQIVSELSARGPR